MKYKVLASFFIATVVCASLSFFQHAHGDGQGAAPARTGSPADGLTCANTCHTGSAVTPVTGWITSNIPVQGYTPGATYTITATASHATRNEFGFEMSPQDANGFPVGTMANQNGQTQLVGIKYITHTGSGTAGTGNSKTWNFSWTAPRAGTGSFHFYGAFNATNNNNMSSGDLIYTENILVNEAAPTGTDCGVFDVINPNTTPCDSIITPIIKLENFGTDTLDSTDVRYFVDAMPADTFHWAGSLATGQSTLVTLPSVTVAALGTHTFTATTLLPNGGNDTVPSNDTRTSTFFITYTGLTLPFSEGFESTTFIPAGWQLFNRDGSTTWARSTSAHATGVASARMNNFAYSGRNERDELITPALDLTSDPNPTLTFKVAYKLKTSPSVNPHWTDSLNVLISTDCGATWTSIYLKSGTTLTTTTPTFSAASFNPTAAQWRTETVSLAPYQACTHAYIKFRNTCEYENNLYLDDIYINGPAAVNDPATTADAISVFPNPANDAMHFDFALSTNSDVSYEIFDLDGNSVSKVNKGSLPRGNYSEQISTAGLPAGVYFLRMECEGIMYTKKFVVLH